MFGRKQPEVLVVGAGPVGLFSALYLTQNNIPVSIIDKDWGRAGHSYALALHPLTFSIFKKLGLHDGILANCYKIKSINYFDLHEKHANISLDALPDQPFIAVLQQQILEHILEEKLNKSGVHVQWNHNVNPLLQYNDHVAATVNKLEFDSVGYAVAHTDRVITRSHVAQVQFVIGADGHHSYVRRSQEIPFKEVSPVQSFAVFEFRTDYDFKNTMSVILDDNSANVAWPLPENYCRWSFEIPEKDASKQSREKDRYEIQIGTGKFPLLDDAHLKTYLKQRAPWFDGSISDIRWRLIVRFEKRLAESFGKGRCWIIGDAAHMAAPIGIQSMNMGIKEAQALCDMIIEVIKGNQQLSSLENFNQRFLNEWQQLLSVRDVVSLPGNASGWMKQHGQNLISTIPATGEDLIRLLKQVDVELK